MNDTPQARELAKDLLSRLDYFLGKWLAYCKQKNITRLLTNDWTIGALGHYLGTGNTFVEMNCIPDAVDVLHMSFNTPQNPDITAKVESVDKAFLQLFDIIEDYFDGLPVAIKQIPFLIRRCYKQREALFVDLDEEQLVFYINSAEKDAEQLALWEKEQQE